MYILRHGTDVFLDSLQAIKSGFSVTTPARTVFEARMVAENELVNSNNARICGVISDSEYAELERQVGMLLRLIKELEIIAKKLDWLQQSGDDKREKEEREKKLRNDMQVVRNALERWGTPSFGKCSRCRRPIHPGRVEFMPWLALCVECGQVKKEVERGRVNLFGTAMAVV